jgi:hypothetical protein
MKNREAGYVRIISKKKPPFLPDGHTHVLRRLIYAGDGTLQVRKFAENVFLHDWQEGSDYKVEQTYSKSQMNIITDP